MVAAARKRGSRGKGIAAAAKEIQKKKKWAVQKMKLEQGIARLEEKKTRLAPKEKGHPS